MEKEYKLCEEDLKEALKTDEGYKNIFLNLSEEEKEIYFVYLSSYYAGRYLREKDSLFVLNYMSNNSLEELDTYVIFEMIDRLENKELVAEVIKSIPSKVITHFRFRYYIKDINSDFVKVIIFNHIVTLGVKNYDLKTLLDVFESDKYKIKYFSYLTKSYQVDVIKEFKDLELKKEYVMKSEYSDYRSDLVASVEDDDFVLSVFDKIKVKKFRFNLIRKVKNPILKEKLIAKLGNKTLTEFVESFGHIDNMVDVGEDVDPSITIGVELETCHKDIEALKILQEMPHGFRIKRDASVNKGFEIVSPILHYTNEEMGYLNDICTMLKENSFYTDSSCGGHIHLGADYLETIDEYKMFIHLYCNFEDIIYLICNRENTKGRSSITRYAAKVKGQYSKAQKDGVFDNNYASLEDFRETLVGLNDSRYKGLNLYNLRKYYINTFEFRMANGEIEYEELVHNIKLYARLLQVSKELVSMKEDDKRRELLIKLNGPLREVEKLNLMLDLLFTSEEDKAFYRNRYKKNITVLRNFVVEHFKKEEVVPIVDTTKLILIPSFPSMGQSVNY